MSVCVCICVCVCVCMSVYVCEHLCLSVCVYISVYVTEICGSVLQQQSRVSSDGYKGERRLEKKTESFTWSRSFPGSPLPSVSSSQAAPSGLTLLPLLGLVVSQSPFLSDQQLMQVLSNCTRPWCISCSLYITLCWQSGSVSRICLLAPWPSSLNSSSFLWVSQFIIFDPVFTFHQSCTNEKVSIQHVLSKPPKSFLDVLNKFNSWI